jgi:hypothetical protein
MLFQTRFGMLAMVASLVFAGLSNDALAKGKIFPSADSAVQELFAAASANDQARMIDLFGAENRDWLISGDPVADRQAIANFIAAYKERHSLQAQGNDKITLVIGGDDFPFPFPIVKVASGWAFDVAEGKQEVLRRRIGHNELNIIEVMRAFVDAQREYASRPRDGNKAPQYARRFVSTPGRQDGLYWPTSGSDAPSPLGETVVKAIKDGYDVKRGPAQPAPYYGYYFRMLTEQGKAAPGGAYSYIANGRMIGGFAVVAFPASYGVSGVMTFLVSDDGIVYEKDLGPNTASIVGAMKAYDPDGSWKAD